MLTATAAALRRAGLGGAAWRALAAGSGAASPGFATAAAGPGLLEIREYTLHPAGFKAFMALAAEAAELRGRLLPFLGMFTCDTGGDLNTVTHLYHYKDLAQREAVRAAAARDVGWQEFIDESRPHVARQSSRIMLESAPVYAALGLPGAAGFASPRGPAGAAPEGSPVYELRQYQLHPGYGSVPKLLAAFADGLPDKVAADADGRLVAFAHSDVGVLNQVVELWRYPSAAGCIRARESARKVPKWRDTIAAVTPGVQQFQTSLLRSVPFSPWQ
ncbi:NIPSNAP3A [Scenedesmus sp. PABB004]|nr:NIPSNAP3A [Scenedesmus sp. PABB004]